ncbi:MAG: SRPBCC domain-containing protein [Saprospiraceae bacterium]
MQKKVFIPALLLFFIYAPVLAQNTTSRSIMTKKYDKTTNLRACLEVAFGEKKRQFFDETRRFLKCIPLGTDEKSNEVSAKKRWFLAQRVTSKHALIIWPQAFNPENSKFYVHNEIEINAQPQVVWGILINAKEWHTYNKGAQSPIEFVDTTAKTLQDGLKFNFHTMGLKFQPIINEFVPYERLAWTSRIKSIQGYHAWVIVPTANGCRLITAESQNGFLTFMQKVFQPKKLLKLHDEWLNLIKERAEKN